MNEPEAERAYAPYRESFRTTAIRTGTIAVIIATIATFRGADDSLSLSAKWATLLLCALWFSFGGHWIEIFFLNFLRPTLPRSRTIQSALRIMVWFVGGIALTAGMRLTWELLLRTPAPWTGAMWQGGLSFIIVELVAHALLLQARGLPSFYNGKG